MLPTAIVTLGAHLVIVALLVSTMTPHRLPQTNAKIVLRQNLVQAGHLVSTATVMESMQRLRARLTAVSPRPVTSRTQHEQEFFLARLERQAVTGLLAWHVQARVNTLPPLLLFLAALPPLGRNLLSTLRGFERMLKIVHKTPSP